MKNPDDNNIRTGDQRGKYDFLIRYLTGMDNYREITSDGRSKEEDYIRKDALDRDRARWEKWNAPRFNNTPAQPSNGLAPDVGKFRDHRWDNYIMGLMNVGR